MRCGHVQLCSKHRGDCGIDAETLQKKGPGSAFSLSSDHGTTGCVLARSHTLPHIDGHIHTQPPDTDKEQPARHRAGVNSSSPWQCEQNASATNTAAQAVLHQVYYTGRRT